MEQSVQCQRCGANLAPGSLKFLLTIHVTADFDGVLPSGGAMEDLEAFMHQLDADDRVTLEKDVYQSQGYLLCPACKVAFLEDPLGLARETAAGTEGGKMH